MDSKKKDKKLRNLLLSFKVSFTSQKSGRIMKNIVQKLRCRPVHACTEGTQGKITLEITERKRYTEKRQNWRFNLHMTYTEKTKSSQLTLVHQKGKIEAREKVKEVGESCIFLL